MKPFVGSIIAIILLALYIDSVLVAISIVDCVSQPGCKQLTLATFNEGRALVLTLIGGLVSALVIAELSIATPGQVPMARSVVARVPALADPKTPKVGIIKLINVIAGLYILAWVGTGLAAFIVGYMQHPNVLQPLTDFGKSWIGLAVSAGYAYFGIKP